MVQFPHKKSLTEFNSHIHKLQLTITASVSPYTKPSPDELDICSAQVYEILSNKEAVIPPYASYGEAGTMHRLDAEIYDLWKNAQQTTDIDALVEASMKNFSKLQSARKRQTLATADE